MMKRQDAVENIEQSQETTEPVQIVSREQLRGAHEIASQLVAELEKLPNGDLVGQIVATALKLLRDGTNRGDVKLVNSAMKEMRYALKVFAPYHHTRKVSIFGSARTLESHADYVQAASFGKKMADLGWMVITGAGGGIMAAGHGGAGPEPSFGLSIRLPFEQATNTYIAEDPKLINFKYFFTRKLMFVRFSHAIALFPGGFGTMDEGFEVLTLIQTGKSVPMPVVFIDRPGGDYWSHWQEYVDKQLLERGLISREDERLYKITDNVDEAVAEVEQFYNNYHSVRYVRDELVLRLNRAPTEPQLAEINEKFADILTAGSFRVTQALGIERDEPALAHMPRLAFGFNRRDFGRLRMLIDHLNGLHVP
jgi:uncharacterized protein (TIGR00730 family)